MALLMSKQTGQILNPGGLINPNMLSILQQTGAGTQANPFGSGSPINTPPPIAGGSILGNASALPNMVNPNPVVPNLTSGNGVTALNSPVAATASPVIPNASSGANILGVSPLIGNGGIPPSLMNLLKLGLFR